MRFRFIKEEKPKVIIKSTGPILKDAFYDLDQELERLKNKKEKLEKKLDNLSRDSSNTRSEEAEIKNHLSSLELKEIELNNIVQKTTQHLNDIRIRLEKVKKAKGALSEI